MHFGISEADGSYYTHICTLKYNSDVDEDNG